MPLNLSSALACRSWLALTCPGALAMAALLSLTGCHRQQTVAVAPRPTPKSQVSLADITKFRPNEAGAIMIVMYHDFNPSRPNGDLNRTPKQFRGDLESLYNLGYRPVNVSDIISDKMDVPPGRTPIALTFDDSKPTQLRLITGKDNLPHIDPDCAVGILESFSKKHPDWPTKGTFFVLPKEGHNPDPFSQPESVQEKFSYLLGKGYEIANHTSTHSDMHSMKSDKVQWELGTALHDIRQVAPKATLDVFALPYGKLPRDDQARQSLISGTSGGTSYKHKAVLLAAWRPILSPITRADKKLNMGGTFCIYDPYHLERVKPNPKQANQPGTLEYWLRYFVKNPGQRYRSDGNLKLVTVPAAYQSEVDPARVKALGQTLQVYGGGSGKGSKSGGSTLSVE